MDPKFLTAVLRTYTFFGVVLLCIAAYSLIAAGTADTPPGTVPVGEGSAFFIALAAAREVFGLVSRLADGQREHVRDVQLFNSTNNKTPLKAVVVNDDKNPVPTTDAPAPDETKLD